MLTYRRRHGMMLDAGDAIEGTARALPYITITGCSDLLAWRRPELPTVE